MIASLAKFFFFISLQVIENLSRKIMENGKSLDDFVTYSFRDSPLPSPVGTK